MTTHPPTHPPRVSEWVGGWGLLCSWLDVTSSPLQYGGSCLEVVVCMSRQPWCLSYRPLGLLLQLRVRLCQRLRRAAAALRHLCGRAVQLLILLPLLLLSFPFVCFGLEPQTMTCQPRHRSLTHPSAVFQLRYATFPVHSREYLEIAGSHWIEY